MVQMSAHAQSATEFYKAYRAAYAKARSFQDVASFHPKEVVDAVARTPPDPAKAMWETAKERDPKDVKEATTATGATLGLSGA
jgi:hypothetical protein